VPLALRSISNSSKSSCDSSLTGNVVGVLAQVKNLAKLKMITELCVFHC